MATFWLLKFHSVLRIMLNDLHVTSHLIPHCYLMKGHYDPHFIDEEMQDC